jgi:hypothetical protein
MAKHGLELTFKIWMFRSEEELLGWKDGSWRYTNTCEYESKVRRRNVRKGSPRMLNLLVFHRKLHQGDCVKS